MPDPVLPNAATPAPASAPAAPSPEPTAVTPASAQTETQTETPPTLEDIRRVAREEASKIAQSQVAKGENRINQLISTRFAALEQSKGVLGLTPEQVAQAQQKIVTNAYAEPEVEPASANAQPQFDPDQEAAQFVEDSAQTVFKEIGVEVEEGDPEWKAIDESLNDPKGSLGKHLLIVAKQAEAKKARLASQKDKASARSPGGGGTNAAGDAIGPQTTGHELFQRAHAERKK